METFSLGEHKVNTQETQRKTAGGGDFRNPNIFLRETQRKEKHPEAGNFDFSISLGEHKGKAAGGGKMILSISLGKHKGKPPEAGK